jgi:hypothetical protein
MQALFPAQADWQASQVSIRKLLKSEPGRLILSSART